tara:strand:- start:140 stop:418 length:279 start_codon:yes stop_codon:yes gene_type:complete
MDKKHLTIMVIAVALVVLASVATGYLLKPKVVLTCDNQPNNLGRGFTSYGQIGSYATSTTDFLNGGQGSALIVDSMGRLVASTSTAITITTN